MNIIHTKYPRTFHLPWSEGVTDDDKQLKQADSFLQKEVVVTIKQDGENTSLYTDKLHARSLDSADHPSRAWIKNFHGTILNDIPAELRICGENLYAAHSIYYQNLTSYFLAFSMWNNEKNICLPWQETLDYLNLLNIEPVPVLYQGIYDEHKIKELWQQRQQLKDDGEIDEGYVIRITDGFAYEDFAKSCAKFVRPNHVQTSEHWRTQKVIPNSLLTDGVELKKARYQEFMTRQLTQQNKSNLKIK